MEHIFGGFYSYTSNAFCGTWYLPHSHVHNERTVPIIMIGCIAHARNGRISTSGLKCDVIVVFLDPDFFWDAKISAIHVHLGQIQESMQDGGRVNKPSVEVEFDVVFCNVEI